MFPFGCQDKWTFYKVDIFNNSERGQIKHVKNGEIMSRGLKEEDIIDGRRKEGRVANRTD